MLKTEPEMTRNSTFCLRHSREKAGIFAGL